MGENKSEICAKLGELLKLTRAGADIKKIEYNENLDCAVVYCTITTYPRHELQRFINIEGDSGAQLIADVVSEILK